MPWCPKCKSEYREGITQCVECNVALVDELPSKQDEERMRQEELAKQYQMYAQQLATQQEEQDTEEPKPRESGKVYQKKAEKAEEFKSSAYMLVVVGILGLIALVLIELHILPIYLASPGKYITYAVMGFLFIVFIVCGISSFRSSKKYEAEAKTEEDMTSRIKTWVAEQVSKEDIVKAAEVFMPEDFSEEMMYFQYSDILKQKITAEFGELDAAYLDSLCEELYGQIFEGAE